MRVHPYNLISAPAGVVWAISTLLALGSSVGMTIRMGLLCSYGNRSMCFAYSFTYGERLGLGSAKWFRRISETLTAIRYAEVDAYGLLRNVANAAMSGISLASNHKCLFFLFCFLFPCSCLTIGCLSGIRLKVQEWEELTCSSAKDARLMHSMCACWLPAWSRASVRCMWTGAIRWAAASRAEWKIPRVSCIYCHIMQTCKHAEWIFARTFRYHRRCSPAMFNLRSSSTMVFGMPAVAPAVTCAITNCRNDSGPHTFSIYRTMHCI